MGVIRDRWRIWERQQIIDELALTPTDLPSSMATDAEVAALASTNLIDSNLIARHKGVWTTNTSWLTGDIVQITLAVANGYPLGLWRCTTTHLGGVTFSGTGSGYWVKLAGDLDSVTASGAFVPFAASATATGAHRNTPSATFGDWFSFGNAPDSMGFSGTGSPTEAWAPFVVYHKFGDITGHTNTPIAKTTQATAFIAAYYGPTSTDSAEAASSFVGMKATDSAYTQTYPVTAWEAIAQVEGANQVTGIVTGMGARVRMSAGAPGSASHADSAWGFRVGLIETDRALNGAGGSIGNWVSFGDQTFRPATNNWSFYGVMAVQSERSLVTARTGFSGTFQATTAGTGGGSPAMVQIQQPSVSANSRTVTDGAMTNGGTTLTSAAAAFTSNDVDKAITVAGAGAAGGVLTTTISRLLSATQAVLSTAASTTVAAASVTISDPDLIGLKIVQGTGSVQRPFEYWATGAGVATAGINRLGVIFSESTIQSTSGGTAKISMTASALTFVDATNIVAGTTTGTKIGTATTQKLGFYNATPVVQPSGTPAASTDLASVISLANSLRTNLLALGLVA